MTPPDEPVVSPDPQGKSWIDSQTGQAISWSLVACALTGFPALLLEDFVAPHTMIRGLHWTGGLLLIATIWSLRGRLQHGLAMRRFLGLLICIWLAWSLTGFLATSQIQEPQKSKFDSSAQVAGPKILGMPTPVSGSFEAAQWGFLLLGGTMMLALWGMLKLHRSPLPTARSAGDPQQRTDPPIGRAILSTTDELRSPRSAPMPISREPAVYELGLQRWSFVAIVLMLMILVAPELDARNGAGAAAWDRFPYTLSGLLWFFLFLPSLLIPQMIIYAGWMLLSLLLIGFHCSKPNWGTWTFVLLNSWILAAGYWSKALFMREKIHHFGPIEMFEGEAAFLAYAAAGLAAIHVVLIALPPRKVLRASQEHQPGFPSLDELE